MRIRHKIISCILVVMLLIPNTVYAKPTESYNTPNTTAEDTDKTSPCEVTADIHYAYYVSLPASLTLEPVDFVRDVKKYVEMYNMIESEVLSQDSEDGYACWYQVKAKTKEGGLGGKYIKVAPRANKDAFTAFFSSIGKSQEDIDQRIENGYLDCYYVDDCDYNNYGALLFLQNEDTGEWKQVVPGISQKRIYFGDTANEKAVKVDSEKWSSIDGIAFAYLIQGRYKGSFEFVYGLVDSID